MKLDKVDFNLRSPGNRELNATMAVLCPICRGRVVFSVQLGLVKPDAEPPYELFENPLARQENGGGQMDSHRTPREMCDTCGVGLYLTPSIVVQATHRLKNLIEGVS